VTDELTISCKFNVNAFFLFSALYTRDCLSVCPSHNVNKSDSLNGSTKTLLLDNVKILLKDEKKTIIKQ